MPSISVRISETIYSLSAQISPRSKEIGLELKIYTLSLAALIPYSSESTGKEESYYTI